MVMDIRQVGIIIRHQLNRLNAVFHHPHLQFSCNGFTCLCLHNNDSTIFNVCIRIFNTQRERSALLQLCANKRSILFWVIHGTAMTVNHHAWLCLNAPMRIVFVAKVCGECLIIGVWHRLHAKRTTMDSNDNHRVGSVCFLKSLQLFSSIWTVHTTLPREILNQNATSHSSWCHINQTVFLLDIVASGKRHDHNTY